MVVFPGYWPGLGKWTWKLFKLTFAVMLIFSYISSGNRCACFWWIIHSSGLLWSSVKCSRDLCLTAKQKIIIFLFCWLFYISIIVYCVNELTRFFFFLSYNYNIFYYNKADSTELNKPSCSSSFFCQAFKDWLSSKNN